MSDTKVILISHLPLPYHKIGSWTKMYENYIKQNKSEIDIIICPTLKESPFDDIKYYTYNKPPFFKIKSKLYGSRFFHVLIELWECLQKNPENKFIIQIVDNYGLLSSLCKFVKSKKLKHKLYIQYFFHGFILESEYRDINKVFLSIDELILLTDISLNNFKKNHNNIPKQLTKLHNGIDTSIFNTKDRQENKNKIFLWCSQDRPKKGLDIILKIWNKFHQKYQNAELWVVGTQKKINGKGIKSYGRVANENLPDIYKKADVYLFPTQWEEPFGLSLIEALHCGCFCIASNLGGVPEVLNYGEFGWLIDEPDNPENWFNAMHKYMQTKPNTKKIPEELYSINTWISSMNNIIENAKIMLELKN